jgi:YjbE family integral membrane protein
VDSITQYLSPEHWGATLDNFGHAAFWAAVLQIVLINILLSGDNAVVIALACRGLPRRQRFWGLVIGAGVAVILLIIFAVVVTQLMRLPYLKVIGGVALVYIAAKLLVPQHADKNEVEAAAHLWRAVRIVLVADIIMSLDNIIAVAALAQGNVVLLAIGLIISIPIIVAGAALAMALLDRFPILVWAGAALLGWIAGGVIATDPAVSSRLMAAFGGKFVQQTELAAAGAGAVLVIAAGGLWRHLKLSKLRAEAVGEEASGR